MIHIVYGTRAELIKFSTLIRELRRRRVDFKTVDTGQHDNRSLNKSLNLPEPDYHLGNSPREKWSFLQSSLATYPLAALLAMFWGIYVFFRLSLILSKSDVLVTHGNTITVPVAICSAKIFNRKINLVHMESGFRGRKKSSIFLDFIYRFSDKRSDVLFAPYESSKRNLSRESIRGRVILSGDIVSDVVRETLRIRPKKKTESGNYVLVNIARSIVKREDAKSIMDALKRSPMKIVLIMNPVIKKRIKKFGFENYLNSNRIKKMNPVDYPDFLHLLQKSKGSITDSNGVEEECAFLGKPCIAITDFIHIPELVKYGFVRRSGCNTKNILDSLESMRNGSWKLPRKMKAKNPTKKIADYLSTLNQVF